MSVATSTFLSAWRSNARRPVLLAKVEITNPSTKTLYLSSEAETWANTQAWQHAIVGFDPIRASGRMLDPGPSLCTCALVLAAGRQSGVVSATLEDSLASYQWQGATVTLWFWDKSLSSWTDALQVFKGRVNRPVLQGRELTLYLMQADPLEAAIPDKTLNKVDYPNAPDAGAGVPIPIVYGEFLTLDMRTPWGTPYGYKDDQEDVGAGVGAVPGLLTDPGYAGNDVRVTYSSHALTDLEDRTSGMTQFIVGNDQLNPLDTAATQETLTGDSYIEIDDDEMLAYYGAIPNDIVTATSSATPNTALNPRNAMDVFDETTYATLDQSLSYSDLVLRLPRPPVLGVIVETYVSLGYSGDAANTHNLQVFPFYFPTGVSHTVVSVAATSGTPAVLTGAWTTTPAWDTSTWAINGGDGGIGIRVNFAGGTTNKARIYWACIRIKYRPARNLVTPAFYTTIHRDIFGGYDIVLGQAGLTTGPAWYNKSFSGDRPSRPAIYDIRGQFYGHLKGYADDGSGTYTGSAGSVIQRAPDIARHLLVTYAGVSGSDIETGSASTDFGSFVRARDFLNGGLGQGYNLACHIGQQTKVKRVLQAIATQSASTIYLDRFTNKWRFVTWGTEEGDAYDLTLDKESLLDHPRQDPISDVDVRQRIAVRYFTDYFRNRQMFESIVLPGRSSRGYNQANYRDQQAFTVTAGNNDDLDWKYGATTYADVLAAATYSDAMALASQARTQMRTRSTEVHVGWGFSIRTGYNDKLDISVGGTPYAGTVAEGDYGPEGLCDAVETALNALGSGRTFTCTYSYSSHVFTVTATGGTFNLLPDSGANTATSAWFALGFTTDNSGITTLTAGFARYAERFWVATANTASNIELLFSTGASAATSCARLLGFEQYDYAAAHNHSAPFRRNNREATLSTAETSWGEHEQLNVSGDYIRQENVAVVLRDRLADLLANPPMRISFPTHRCPDLQRGRVIQFASNVDDIAPFTGYGSNGSWAGKRFRVVEVIQHAVTAWHTEVVAVEVE